MDNLTHTLIGTLAGEALARTAARHQDDLPEAVRRNVFVTLAAIGSNLPDADLLYSYIGATRSITFCITAGIRTRSWVRCCWLRSHSW